MTTKIFLTSTLFAILLIGTALFLGQPVHSIAALPAAAFTVDSTVDATDADPGDGACATAAGECTLRAAIQEANAFAGADTVILPAGVYTRTIGGIGVDASAGDLNITDTLTIVGEGRAITIIDADTLDRVFAVSNGAHAQISNVTIQRGSTAGIGGGIHIEAGASATLDNVAIIDNVGFGGGVETRGIFIITNSLIDGNQAPDGSGGGISSLSPLLRVISTTISNNTATDRGGGIFATQAGGTVELRGVAIVSNTADYAGGAITNLGPTMTLVNVTISGNQADVEGGGIDNHSALVITNSTIVSNTSWGLYNNPINYGTITVKNTIVADNVGDNCGGTITSITSLGHNMDSGTTCNFTVTGDISDTLPLLGPLQDNGGSTLTHAPLPGSPAIDAGDNAACPAIDQRGYPRPTDDDGIAICDMGAYEQEPTIYVGDVTFEIEGDSGTVTTAVAITLTAPTSQVVTVDYATSDGTATAGDDYVPISNTTLTFTPGITTQSIAVSVRGDVLDEPDETFWIDLSNPANASLKDVQGQVTILDDDVPIVGFSSTSYTVSEESESTTITTTLNAASWQTVVVDYATADGTATAGEDYVAVSGTLTFTPGITVQIFSVSIISDTQREDDETILVSLHDPVNATLVVPMDDATLTIIDEKRYIYLPLVLR